MNPKIEAAGKIILDHYGIDGESSFPGTTFKPNIETNDQGVLNPGFIVVNENEKTS